MLRTAHICWRCSASLSPTLIEAEQHTSSCVFAAVRPCSCASMLVRPCAERLPLECPADCSRLVWHLYLIGEGHPEVDQPAVRDAVPLGLQALLVSYVVLVSLFLVNSAWALLESLAALPRRKLRPVLGGDREVRK